MDDMPNEDEQVLYHRLRARVSSSGGFMYVGLRDADTGAEVILNEGAIAALHHMLGEIISSNGLDR